MKNEASRRKRTPPPRPRTTGLSYVRLNVTNLRRSAEWYMEVFGMQVVQGTPESDHVLLCDPLSRMEIALLRTQDTVGDRFDKNRIGLNHIEFGVTSQQELADWGAYLDAKRIPRLPVHGHSGGRWITFRDPDGIILEVCWVIE